MPESKHSPGPWSMDAGFVIGRFPDGSIHDICDPRCAPVEFSDTMDANARLIAAAPEMLTALDKIHSWLVTAAIASPQDMAQSFPEMERIASEALAKTKEA
jgi:hypothetical protein